MLLTAGGCADKAKKLGPGEAYLYKRELLQSRPKDLSPRYLRQFGYHPAQTRAELDAAFQEYARLAAAERAADQATARARMAEERKAKDKAMDVDGSSALGKSGSGESESGESDSTTEVERRREDP